MKDQLNRPIFSRNFRKLRSVTNDAVGEECDTTKKNVNTLAKRRLANQVGQLEEEREALRRQLSVLDINLRQAKQAKRELNQDPKGSNGDLDMGFLRESAGLYFEPEGPGLPRNILLTAAQSLWREGGGLLQALLPFLQKEEMEPEKRTLLARLQKLELSNAAIWERERSREEVYAPWFIKIPYLALCYTLDFVFDGRPIPRFWFLETVARTPYFSYNVMLYIYEVVGWWRRSSDLRKVHFAEEWNEYHHLLIMESMGGDRGWADRFLGYHSAVLYFLALLFLWLISPTTAYNFSELIEAHAVDTYAQFLDQNEDLLKTLPPPAAALQYYESTDMYLFDEFQTSRVSKSRRPTIGNLYDVFLNIREDEGEHVKTMEACQDQNSFARNPSTVALATAMLAAIVTLPSLLSNVASKSGVELIVDGSLDIEALIDLILTVIVL
eukprot:CAMPEP_0196584484 /NCGR_PEP_ID=MMETSP1081-20130531/47193_1 /TAXON_ID=36882 /ORGANISM="Pyramimonas amylifera, Strain CCMP720" /LENGTH=439 /DNA_ID=CAMNT_0041905697 /DNA_START=123 /DNA_END=1442 /DNA_ORIENTATION=+